MIHRVPVRRYQARSLVSTFVAATASLLLATSAVAASWSPLLTMGTSGNYALESSRSVAASGSVVHAIMWQDQSIAYQRSTNGAVSWQPDVQLAVKNSTTSYRALAIAASGDLVVALFKARGPSNKQSLYLRRSTNGGQTWKSKLTIASYTNAGKEMGDGDVVVVGSKVLVTWTDRTTSKILARRSTDGGATFKAVQNIGTTSNGSGSYRDGNVAATVTGAKVFIVWKPQTDKGIVLRRSTDSGATWKPRQSITTGKVGYQTPAASASGSRLLVTYTLGSGVAKVARSTNSGGTFSSTSVSPADSASNDVLVSGSTARLTYTHSPTVYVRFSTDGGATWTAAEQIHGYGAEGNVVLSGGHTVVVFYAPDEFTATTFSRRST